MRSPAFARAWAGTLLVSIPATLPHAMLAGTAREVGVSRADALALLGLIGLGTIAGRFLIAAIADAIGRRTTFVACCAGMSGSMLVWALAEDAAALQGFALVFGALQGGFVALLPAFGADTFGARSVGGVLGLLYTSRGVALLLAPPLVAALLDAAGHGVPLAAVAALGVAGSLILARMPRLPDG
ncbi:MFS transporter, partial [Roseomonas rosulenta]|uniref:MFS transporter n=1 Tax=Roseomonas rosulenta TaxID=2748667 RepID=UPI0018DFE785